MGYEIVYGFRAWIRLSPNVEIRNDSLCHCKSSARTIYVNFLICISYYTPDHSSALDSTVNGLEVYDLANELD